MRGGQATERAARLEEGKKAHVTGEAGVGVIERWAAGGRGQAWTWRTQ